MSCFQESPCMRAGLGIDPNMEAGIVPVERIEERPKEDAVALMHYRNGIKRAWQLAHDHVTGYAYYNAVEMDWKDFDEAIKKELGLEGA